MGCLTIYTPALLYGGIVKLRVRLLGSSMPGTMVRDLCFQYTVIFGNIGSNEPTFL